MGNTCLCEWCEQRRVVCANTSQGYMIDIIFTCARERFISSSVLWMTAGCKRRDKGGVGRRVSVSEGIYCEETSVPSVRICDARMANYVLGTMTGKILS
jgi:hypothetical protein